MHQEVVQTVQVIAEWVFGKVLALDDTVKVGDVTGADLAHVGVLTVPEEVFFVFSVSVTEYTARCLWVTAFGLVVSSEAPMPELSGKLREPATIEDFRLEGRGDVDRGATPVLCVRGKLETRVTVAVSGCEVLVVEAGVV
jgi:hypothetical protein